MVALKRQLFFALAAQCALALADSGSNNAKGEEVRRSNTEPRKVETPGRILPKHDGVEGGLRPHVKHAKPSLQMRSYNNTSDEDQHGNFQEVSVVEDEEEDEGKKVPKLEGRDVSSDEPNAVNDTAESEETLSDATEETLEEEGIVEVEGEEVESEEDEIKDKFTAELQEEFDRLVEVVKRVLRQLLDLEEGEPTEDDLELARAYLFSDEVESSPEEQNN